MATTRVQLLPASWTDCGTTPCYVQNTGTDQAFYVIDTAAPGAVSDISTVPAHVLMSDGDDLADVNISLTGQRVYARGKGALTISR